MEEIKDGKVRLLALYDYLKENSDDQHRLSTNELVSGLENLGYKINRKQIKDDIAVLTSYGYDILNDKTGPNANVYWLGERKFELPELKLLSDAVSSSHFIPAKKSEELIAKLSTYASKYQRSALDPKIYASNRVKQTDNKVFYEMDRIATAIEEKKKVTFQYTDYDADKKVILRHDGASYVASPYAFLWNDDFYYLVAYSDEKQKIVTFRVDRIVKAKKLKDDIVPEPADFDINDFAAKVFEMYDGTEQEVELLCENGMMRYVVDHFGEDIETERVDDSHFLAKVQVSASPTFYAWVFRFCGAMKITAPETVRNEYQDMARKALG